MPATTITLEWLGGPQARARTEDGITVEVSTARSYGEGAAVSPMELLLVSLASCSALAAISILTRLTQGLRAVSAEAQGTIAEGYPKVFREIEVRYTFSGEGLRDELVQKAFALMEEKYCPVSAMLGEAVNIRYIWRIDGSAPTAA